MRNTVHEPLTSAETTRWAEHLRNLAYYIARRTNLDHDDAEDCAQECLCQLIEAFGPSLLPLHPVDDPETWMRKCVIRRVQDCRRHLTSERRHLAAAPVRCGEPVSTLDWEPTDSHLTPEEAMLHASSMRAVFAILVEFSRESFLCFIRRYCLEESVNEVAAATGLEPNTVSHIVRRTAKRLRKRLGESGFTGADLAQSFPLPAGSPASRRSAGRQGEIPIEESSTPDVRNRL